jgi:hypothetical protein
MAASAIGDDVQRQQFMQLKQEVGHGKISNLVQLQQSLEQLQQVCIQGDYVRPHTDAFV